MNIGNVSMNIGVRFCGAQPAASPVKNGGLPQGGVMGGGLTIGVAEPRIGQPGGCGGIDPVRLNQEMRTDDPLGLLVGRAFNLEAPPFGIAQ